MSPQDVKLLFHDITKSLEIFLLCSRRGVEYCDQRVCVSVW